MYHLYKPELKQHNVVVVVMEVVVVMVVGVTSS